MSALYVRLLLIIHQHFKQKKKIGLPNLTVWIIKLAAYSKASVIATALHYLIMSGAIIQLGLNPTIATMIGFTFGALTHHQISHKDLAPKNLSRWHTHHQFFITAMAGGIVNTATFHLLMDWTQGIAAAQLASTVLAFYLTFLVNCKWAFRKRPETP